MPDTATLTLTDFLLARIAEDERAADLARAGSMGTARVEHWTANGKVTRPGTLAVERVGSWSPESRLVAHPIDEAEGKHIARWDPARVLAECEAKRTIIVGLTGEQHPVLRITMEDEQPAAARALDIAAAFVFRQLALSYADHPDYRDEWRPAA